MPMIPKPAISELAFEIAILRGINPARGEVPEPDTDPADCMELLRYMADNHFTVSHWKSDNGLFYVADIGDSHATGATLELAIATAARDALRSLRGEE